MMTSALGILCMIIITFITNVSPTVFNVCLYMCGYCIVSVGVQFYSIFIGKTVPVPAPPVPVPAPPVPVPAAPVTVPAAPVTVTAPVTAVPEKI